MGWLWLKPMAAGAASRPVWRRLRTLLEPAPDTATLLAAHAAGEDRGPELVRRNRRHPHELERRLAAMLGTVAGGARDRLSRLALQLGLVVRWQEQARAAAAPARCAAIARLASLPWGVADSTLLQAMLDEDREVRLEAARALLRGGARPNLEEVFAWALAQPSEVRMELADDLRTHSLVLAERALPAALASEDTARVAAALDLVPRWGRALPLAGLAPLARHRDPGIRARALRAALYDSSLRPLDAEILKALWDEAPEVRAAACAAAARLRLEAALPAILDCLRHREPALAQAAAAALAEMGPAGLAALEAEVRLAWDPSTAAAALAAVEQVKTERYGYTRL